MALIDVIHQTLVSRLSGSYFQIEANTLFGIMQPLFSWSIQLSQPDANQSAIDTARQVIANQPANTLAGVQSDLNEQDTTGGPVYRGDDLSDSEVITRVLDGRKA